MLKKVFHLFSVLLIPPVFTTNASTELSFFSVFATNIVWVCQGADVNSGNMGVSDASPRLWLDPQPEVTIGHDDNIADGVC